MQEIEINTGVLATDIGRLREALGKARKQLENMFTDIQELDAMWDGPANEEFRKQFTNDYANSKELCNTVDSIIECMQYAREQYEVCENEVGDIINRITI